MLDVVLAARLLKAKVTPIQTLIVRWHPGPARRPLRDARLANCRPTSPESGSIESQSSLSRQVPRSRRPQSTSDKQTPVGRGYRPGRDVERRRPAIRRARLSPLRRRHHDGGRAW